MINNNPPRKNTKYNLSAKNLNKLRKIKRINRNTLTPRNIYTNFQDVLHSSSSKTPLDLSFCKKHSYQISFNILSNSTPFVPYIEKNGDLIVERELQVSIPLQSVFENLNTDKQFTSIFEVFYIKINEYYINKFKHGKKRKNPDIPIPPPIDNLKCREIFVKYYFANNYNDTIKNSLIAVLSGELNGIGAQNVIWNFFENNILSNPNENEFIKLYLPDFYKKYEEYIINKISSISSNFN